MTLPLPDSRPLQPSTSELNSHALLVESTLIGRLRPCRLRIVLSCWATCGVQSLMARMVGTSSNSRSSVAAG